MLSASQDPAEEVLREMEQEEYEKKRLELQHLQEQGLEMFSISQEDPAEEVLREMEQEEYERKRLEQQHLQEQAPILPYSQAPCREAPPQPLPMVGLTEPSHPKPDDASSKFVRRRIGRKQKAPPAFLISDDQALRKIFQAALEAEDEEPALLATTVKRKHVHWTHVRTHKAEHKQPSEFTREQFWAHLARCYKEVYPDVSSPTGSILAFGLIVKEFHKAFGDEHKHGATFCLAQHYWNKVAKHSLDKYGVPLNAVAHDSYLTMYAYLRHPSKCKTLSELDPDPYMSPRHPRGGALQELLGKSNASLLLQRNKSDNGRKRQRLSVFEEIKKHDLQDALALQAHACNLAESGKQDLAEYCTRQAGKLEEVVAGARAVLGAPMKMKAANATLLEKLEIAAKELPCECDGRWVAGATKVLSNSRIPVQAFTSAVYNALRIGARRGANVACVGSGGCGKSTLLESLEKIYNCAGKPERGSTFPLSSVKGCEVVLWQDYEHDEGTIRFSDLLSLFVGESVGVRLPGQKNAKFRNTAPLFYSGRAPITLQPSRLHDVHTAAEYSGMMNERFTMFHFTQPLPLTERQMDFPQCGRCTANFYLTGRAGYNPCLVPPQPRQDFIKMLEDVHALYTSGVLSDTEFATMKAKILGTSLMMRFA